MLLLLTATVNGGDVLGKAVLQRSEKSPNEINNQRKSTNSEPIIIFLVAVAVKAKSQI